MPSARHRSRRSKRAEKETPKGFVLLVEDGRQRGEEYHFETECTIGRTAGNDVIIVDDSISRNHARIWGKRGVFMVEDLGSSNGTRVNGKIIEGPEVLRDGDYVTVGVVTLLFSNLEMGDAGEPTAIINLSEKQQKKLDFEEDPWAWARPVLDMWEDEEGKKKLIGAGAALFVLILAIMWMLIDDPDKGRVNVYEDYSDMVVTYDESNWEDFMFQVFGYCKPSEVTSSEYCQYCKPFRASVKIEFVVTGKNRRVKLYYAAGKIEKDKEVEILLNGKRIQYAEWAPPNRAKFNYVVDLYHTAKERKDLELKEGKNILEFRNTYNKIGEDGKGHGDESWYIFYIRLKTTALPKPNPQKAMEYYSVAKEMFNRREVIPSYYKEAYVKFSKVVDLLELSDRNQPEIRGMYEDSISKLNILERDFDNMFEKTRALLWEASRTENKKEMQDMLGKIQKIIKRFPEGDLRRRKLEDILKQLTD